MKQDSNNQLKYFIYARKSSDDKDRQIQSTGDQIQHLQKMANSLGLKIVDVISESKSAKKPHIREKFDGMMERIKNGEGNGILCWQISRLSRNPIDSGTLSWLLQQEIIKSIKTIDKEYLPSDNIILFSVETGSANQFILDLIKNTKRGLKSKIKKGWMPAMAPLGYLNTVTEIQGENYITKDPKRFDLVRKMWDLMLTGAYTAPQILDIANEEWGFRTRKTKRKGGKPMSKSTIYKIFTNPFYAGLFEYSGEIYQGSHEAMITLDEFDRVQELLGRNGRPRPQTHQVAYTGMVVCSECGCQITCTVKRKFIKSEGIYRTYEYYHCTGKKVGANCTQRKYIPKKDLERQINEKLSKLTIIDDFKQWALETLNEQNDTELKTRQTISQSINDALESTQKQIDSLTQMRYRNLIDDDEYLREKTKLKGELKDLRSKRIKTDQRADKWLELTERTFNFAQYAQYHFNHGDLRTKKEIFSALGKEIEMLDGIVNIDTNKWLRPIEENYKTLEKEYLKVRTDKKMDDKAKSNAFAALRLQWGGRPDSNRRPPLPQSSALTN